MTSSKIALSLIAALAAVGLAGALLAEEPEPVVNDSMFAKAWEMTRGSADVLVGVLDLGFDFYHRTSGGGWSRAATRPAPTTAKSSRSRPLPAR